MLSCLPHRVNSLHSHAGELLFKQGLKADLQTGALPMESTSSGDIYRKHFCFLISAPTVSTLAPFLGSPPVSASLVAHVLLGCPRGPHCLSWPLPRHLCVAWLQIIHSAAELFAASFGKAAAKLWEQ